MTKAKDPAWSAYDFTRQLGREVDEVYNRLSRSVESLFLDAMDRDQIFASLERLEEKAHRYGVATTDKTVRQILDDLRDAWIRRIEKRLVRSTRRALVIMSARPGVTSEEIYQAVVRIVDHAHTLGWIAKT